MANIAKNIRLLRTAQKMTQDQLAESLHVTRQTVSNYETGKSQPDIDTIVCLAEALQADPNTLIYGIPTPPDRKREYIHAAIAAAVALLMAAVYGIFREPLLLYVEKLWGVSSIYLMVFFCRPLLYLMIGYAAGCVFVSLSRYHPLKGKWIKWVIMALLMVYVVILIAFSCAADLPTISIWFRDHILDPVLYFLASNPLFFLIIGVILRLFQQKERN